MTQNLALEEDPRTHVITRKGLCAYKDCARGGRVERVTNSGFRVGYCPEHYRQAADLFYIT